MTTIWSIIGNLEDLCPDRLRAEIARRRQFIKDITESLWIQSDNYESDCIDLTRLKEELTILTSILVTTMTSIKEVLQALDKEFENKKPTRKELEEYARELFPNVSCQCVITSAVQRWLALRNLPY